MEPMMPETYTVFDAANYLKTNEEMALYLEASAESGDPAEIVSALRTVVRARGMADVARKASISREGLYKALGDGAKPGFGTIVQIARALDLEVVFRPLRAKSVSVSEAAGKAVSSIEGVPSRTKSASAAAAKTTRATSKAGSAEIVIAGGSRSARNV